MSRSFSKELAQGLAQLGLVLTETQHTQLLDYLDLLQKWSQVYNLTALRQPDQILSHHLLDCLATVPDIQQRYPAACDVLDVGSGAGLPALVYAVVSPEWRITALDAVAKKMAFVQNAANTLGLTNLVTQHARVERLVGQYDLITCRAYSTLADFVTQTKHLLKPGGRWAALKGKLPAQEQAALPPAVFTEGVQNLAVPGLEGERCLVWLSARA